MFDPSKLGEEADSMIASLNQQTDTPSGTEDQGAVNADAIAQPTSAEAQAGDDQGVETKPSADISAELTELKKQAETADQRWRVLQGMIDKKDDEIQSLRTLLAQISVGKQEPAQAKDTQPIGVTQTDISEYGDDIIGVMGRKASQVANDMLEPLRRELQELKASLSNVATTTVHSAQEQFNMALTATVPDWRTINKDPAFIQWLSKPAPFSNKPKMDMLHEAYNMLDTQSVAQFFLAYQAETNPPAEQIAAPAPNPNKLVAPGRSKAPTNSAGNTVAGRMWTRDDIAKLYDNKMAGKIGQKEFDELERDIFKAMRENRVAA